MSSYKKKVWNNFCRIHNIANDCVSLFNVKNDTVNVIEVGTNNRRVLERSPEMESLVINEVNKVIADYSSGTNNFEGLIYMMFWCSENQIKPLYIGKSEKHGRKGNLSANIKNIESNKQRFCRWGYNYAYHIGSLSAVVCEGHPEEKLAKNYEKWAEKLFLKYPTSSPKLRHQVYFWIKAWETGSIGIWEDFGETSLAFLEYLLIGVASDLFPDSLLNNEGVNRI